MEAYNVTSEPRDPIHIFIVSCSKDEKSAGNEDQTNMVSQISTMVKTINFFTIRDINIHLITNMVWVFEEVKKEVEGIEDIRNIK